MNKHLAGTHPWAVAEMMAGQHCSRETRFGQKTPVLVYSKGQFRVWSTGKVYQFRTGDYLAEDWVIGTGRRRDLGLVEAVEQE